MKPSLQPQFRAFYYPLPKLLHTHRLHLLAMPIILILKRFPEVHSLIPCSLHQVCFLFLPWNVALPLDTLTGDPTSALKGLLSGGGGEGKSFDKLQATPTKPQQIWNLRTY